MITWNTGPAAMRARFNLKLKLKNRKRKKRQAASRKHQDYINGERLQHALGWKGSSDFGPKPQAPSFKQRKFLTPTKSYDRK